MADNTGDSFNGATRKQPNLNDTINMMMGAGVIAQLNTLHILDAEQWRVFAYELACDLAEEVHYSATPSSHTLELLERALQQFPYTEFAKRYVELKIAELQPVD